MDHPADDPPGKHVTPDLRQADRERETAFEQHDPIERQLGPQAGDHQVRPGKLDEVRLDLMAVPGRVGCIPAAIESPGDINRRINHDEEVDIGPGRGLLPRPGPEHGDGDQLVTKLGTGAGDRGRCAVNRREIPDGCGELAGTVVVE